MGNYAKYFSEVTLRNDYGKPLSQEFQEYRDNIKRMGALDLTDEKIQSQIPEHFWKESIRYEINLFPADLKYINDVIKSDKIFKSLYFGEAKTFKALQRNNMFKNKEAECYQRFYDNENCPENLKKLLYILIGNIKGLMLPKTPIPYSEHDFIREVLLRNHEKYS